MAHWADPYKAGGPGTGWQYGGKTYMSTASLAAATGYKSPKAPTPAGVSYAGGRGADPAAMSALQRAMAYYAPGGGYGKGVEAGLERGRVKAVATGAQSLVSAGLAGTTTIAGLGKRYEEEVAMPARARVEETRAGAISGLEAMKAQIIQGATESARSRALQTYLAQLQASTSMQPSLVGASTPIPEPTRPEQPVYEYPRAPSLVATGAGRYAGGGDSGYAEPEADTRSWGYAGEYYGAAYKKPGLNESTKYMPEFWLGGPMGR